MFVPQMMPQARVIRLFLVRGAIMKKATILLVLHALFLPLVTAFGGTAIGGALPVRSATLTTARRAGAVEAGLLNALRKLRKVEQKPQVVPGAKLPEVDVEICLSSGLAEAAGVAEDAAQEGAPDRVTLSLADAIGDKRTILLGMPGVFRRQVVRHDRADCRRPVPGPVLGRKVVRQARTEFRCRMPRALFGWQVVW